MNEVCVSKDQFWLNFKPGVAETLSAEQRGEIERVLGQPAESNNQQRESEISDIRLSLKWFFVRIAWGPEKRSPERIQKEQEMYPPTARRNMPLLASLFAGTMVLWYAALVVSTLIFAYFIA